MASFMLRQLHGLVDAISVIDDLDESVVDLKFSQEVFSIIANPSPFCRCVIALQFFPQFFENYSCPILRYSWIFFADFYPILFDLERSGFSSLTFSSPDPDRAALKFEGPDGRCREVELPLSSSNDSMDVGEYDCGTFVSIDSQEFINILTPFSDVDSVLVTLTNSQVKFSSKSVDICLSPEGCCCAIGGIEESDQIQFEITLKPTKTFCSIARRSKTVWLFKSNNSSKGVISAFLGKTARYLAYFRA